MGSSGYGSPSGRHLDPERVFALVIRRRRGDLFEYLDSVPGAHTDLQFRLVSFAGMALLAPRSGSSLPWLDDDSWALYWAKYAWAHSQISRLCVPQTVGNAFSYPSDPVLRHAIVFDQLSASSSRTPAVLLSQEQTSYNAVLRHAIVFDQLSASSSRTPAVLLSQEQTSYNAVLKHAVVLDQLSASSSSTPAVLLSPQQTSYNAVINFLIIRSRMLDQTSVFNLGRQASDFAPWRADSTLELAFAKLSLGQLGSDQMTPWELMQNNHGSLAIRVSSLHQHGSAQLTSQRLMLNGEVDIKGKRPASEVVEQKVRVNVASLIAEDGTTAEAGTIVTERVKDLAGAPLQCAAEASMSSGEDSSVVILISKPVENGELRCGTCDLFIARARNGTLLTRLKVVYDEGSRFWLNQLCDWFLRGILRRHRRKVPPSWSWFSIMGKPIINDDGSCVIASCTMCTEAQHRLVFERLHGHGKFTFQAKHPTNLKKRCRKKGVWDPLEGSFTKDVLNVILATQGIPTAKAPNDIFLPLRAFTIIQPDTPLNSSEGRRVQPLELAWIIYRHGPVLGDLLTDEEYENCDQETNCVYKGVLEKVLEKQLKGEGPEGLDGHVVVCYRYRFMCNGDLQLRAMDNHCEEGPLRWIKFAAFSLFTQLHVDPVDPGLLHRRKRNVKKDIFDPFKFLADKLYYFR